MTSGLEENQGGAALPGRGPALAWVVLESLLTVAVLVSADLLAPGFLRTGRLPILAGGWSLVLLGAALWRSSGRSRAWMLELAGGGVALVAAQFWILAPSVGWAGTWRLALGTGVLLAALRQATPGRGWAGVVEALRIGLVAAAGAAVTAPLFNDRFWGGTDGHWYGYMLRDFIEQWRTAGPPVWIGQGQFAWNGGVHPFRSAPVYMNLGGLWDWITGSRLAIASLQHLTGITAAIVGGLTLYRCGARLAPRHRWEAAAIAVVYVTSPGWLMPFYGSEAYMTYLAGAAFTLLFYGNARVLLEGRGWVALAAGMSLAWMSHPPTALLATLVTAGLQLGALVVGQGDRRAWMAAAGGAGLFGILSAYYFTGMAELPQNGRSSLGGDLLEITGLLLGCAGFTQVMVQRRSVWWLALGFLGGGLLWFNNQPWLWWLAGSVLVLGAMTWVWRRWLRCEPADHGAILFLFAVGLAALALDALIRAGIVMAPHYGREIASWLQLWSLNLFEPLATSSRESDFQPGWGLWLGWFSLVGVVWRRRTRPAQVWLAVITLFSMSMLPWPGISRFVVEFFPPGFRDASAVVMPLRAMPVFCILLAYGLVLVVREQKGAWTRALVAICLTAAVIWSGWEARIIVLRALRIVDPHPPTAQDWRTEKIPLAHFAYDLLPVPAYFNHGIFEPRLELRLRDSSGKVLYGPAEAVRDMEAAGVRMLQLRMEPLGTDGHWMKLQPGFTLQPGERVVWRFAFDPSRRYDGHLMFFSEHSYREYHLPASGMVEAFGTGPTHARHLVLWNSGDLPENYWMQVLREPGNDLVASGGIFADVAISAFDPARAALRLESLYPWRARTVYPVEGWLETTRVHLPGYDVRIDGKKVTGENVRTSANGLLEVRLPAGEHTVALTFRGTGKLRVAGGISLLAWVAVVAVAFLPRRPGEPMPSA